MFALIKLTNFFTVGTIKFKKSPMEKGLSRQTSDGNMESFDRPAEYVIFVVESPLFAAADSWPQSVTPAPKPMWD